MSWTKPTFYISIVFIAIIFFVGLINVADDLLNKDRISLSEGSLDYINELKGQSSNSGFDTISEKEVSNTQNIDPLNSDTNNTQVNTDNDFLSTLYVKKERASQPISFFKIVYNIPTSFIVGLGLSVSDFAFYINIITYTVFIALIVLILRWFFT